MGHRALTVHTSHDELSFKTFENKKKFDEVYEVLESARNIGRASTGGTDSANDPASRLRTLMELRDQGLIGGEEYQRKHAEIVASL
jgi:hypothetical protein